LLYSLVTVFIVLKSNENAFLVKVIFRLDFMRLRLMQHCQCHGWLLESGLVYHYHHQQFILIQSLKIKFKFLGKIILSGHQFKSVLLIFFDIYFLIVNKNKILKKSSEFVLRMMNWHSSSHICIVFLLCRSKNSYSFKPKKICNLAHIPTFV